MDEMQKKDYILTNFSANNFCSDHERLKLENKYSNILIVTSKYNRRAVSYQMNKKESVHSWLKYREGFSSFLVESFLKEMKLTDKDTILDPFLGSGTTSLVCQMNNISSIGFDIMPISSAAMRVKTKATEINCDEVKQAINDLKNISIPSDYKKQLETVLITDGAYSESTSIFLSYVTDYLIDASYDELTKDLIRLCILNVLEEVSYTIKGGQYLGWDYRSPKIIKANKIRELQGKKLLPKKVVRSEIKDPKDALLSELNKVISDVEEIQSESNNTKLHQHEIKTEYKQASSLLELPKIDDSTISGVITSPPYCNRYDYTRTYALELVYLGLSDLQIKQMRQDLLSCTVESKSKNEDLKKLYYSLGREDDYNKIQSIFLSNPVMIEITQALEKRKENGDLNNNGVISMVKGYFYELTFIFFEIYRICKKGSIVIFVNDNVRYGGEVVPVDFLSSSLAEQIGFKINKIYTIEQQKGNSSQQMAKFGKVALRKSITVWEK